jgi:hypothetical protein
MAPPVPAICPAKKLLAEEYLEAVRELGQLHEADAKAIIGGDHLQRIDIGLKLARRNIAARKRAYLIHLRDHDC